MSLFEDSDLDRLGLDAKRNMVVQRLDGFTGTLYSLLLDNEGLKASTDVPAEQRDANVAQNEKRIETIRATLDFYRAELDAIDAYAKKSGETVTPDATGVARG